ncbi:hypothetical protein INR49_003244, partial [Caranx melampygus]
MAMADSPSEAKSSAGFRMQETSCCSDFLTAGKSVTSCLLGIRSFYCCCCFFFPLSLSLSPLSLSLLSVSLSNHACCQGDVWICMELMDTSLDKFYKQVIEKGMSIPEDILGKIAVSIVKALEHLHSNLQVIHRDVKPSNVLINTQGQVKMCDFGISGYLVDSVAKTMDAGCKPYMAPERINPETNQKGYNVKSDIWSLGITMIELAILRFPYDSWGTPFQQLKQVVEEPSPQLPADQFSPDFVDFTSQCLKKVSKERPTYTELMQHPFFTSHEAKETDVASFVKTDGQKRRSSVRILSPPPPGLHVPCALPDLGGDGGEGRGEGSSCLTLGEMSRVMILLPVVDVCGAAGR